MSSGDAITIHHSDCNPEGIIKKLKEEFDGIIKYEDINHKPRADEIREEIKGYPFDVALAIMEGFIYAEKHKSYWEYAHYDYMRTRIDMELKAI